MINTVTVRWHDGYLEEFRATEVRFGCDLLWVRLEDGKNRHIPLRSVRWFGMSQESHQTADQTTFDDVVKLLRYCSGTDCTDQMNCCCEEPKEEE